MNAFAMDKQQMMVYARAHGKNQSKDQRQMIVYAMVIGRVIGECVVRMGPPWGGGGAFGSVRSVGDCGPQGAGRH
jgi:hypothetical protein